MKLSNIQHWTRVVVLLAELCKRKPRRRGSCAVNLTEWVLLQALGNAVFECGRDMRSVSAKLEKEYGHNHDWCCAYFLGVKSGEKMKLSSTGSG